jgi:hypothetical protein
MSTLASGTREVLRGVTVRVVAFGLGVAPAPGVEPVLWVEPPHPATATAAVSAVPAISLFMVSLG